MHRARFIIVLSLTLIALSVFALIALIPSFAALEVNTLSAEEVNAQGSGAADSLKSMVRSQALLTAVAPVVSATSSPSRAVIKALELRPKGVTVDHIRYIGASKSIQLGGKATREQLTAYRTALEGDGTFTTVSVPVAALVGSSGQFSITLQGNF
jgi:hypothetical protein